MPAVLHLYEMVQNPAVEFNGLFADLFAPPIALGVAPVPMETYFTSLYGGGQSAATAATPLHPVFNDLYPVAKAATGAPKKVPAHSKELIALSKQNPKKTAEFWRNYGKMNAKQKADLNTFAKKFVTMDATGKANLDKFFKWVKTASPADVKKFGDAIKRQQAKDAAAKKAAAAKSAAAKKAATPAKPSGTAANGGPSTPADAQREQAFNQQYVNLITQGGSVNWVQ